VSELIDAARVVRDYVRRTSAVFGEVQGLSDDRARQLRFGLSELVEALEREVDAGKVDMDAARRGWEYLSENHQVYQRGDFDKLDDATKHVYGLFAKGVLAVEPEPEPVVADEFTVGDVVLIVGPREWTSGTASAYEDGPSIAVVKEGIDSDGDVWVQSADGVVEDRHSGWVAATSLRKQRTFNQGDVIPADVEALRDAFGDDLTRDQDGRWRYGLSFAPGWATDFTLTDSVCFQYPLVEIPLSEVRNND
jgi:hypothetical protein